MRLIPHFGEVWERQEEQLDAQDTQGPKVTHVLSVPLPPSCPFGTGPGVTPLWPLSVTHLDVLGSPRATLVFLAALLAPSWNQTLSTWTKIPFSSPGLAVGAPRALLGS